MSGRGVALIVASTDARGTIRESLEGFLRELGDEGMLVLADASTDGTLAIAEPLLAGTRSRIARRLPGLLVPELWRDGLEVALRTDAAMVGFTTAQMVPRAGWLSALRRLLDETNAAAIGGPIAPGNRLPVADRAIYLHRYGNYQPPLPASDRFEPPGENALYRRDRLEELEPRWRAGFWEADVNRALRERGERLEQAQGAVVEYRGGGRLWPMLRRRVSHASHYGAWRARGRGWGYRLARTAATPLVPALLMGRTLTALRRRQEAVTPWVSALPAMGLLTTAWAAGEAAGCWRMAEESDGGDGDRRPEASRRLRSRDASSKTAHASIPRLPGGQKMLTRTSRRA